MKCNRDSGELALESTRGCTLCFQDTLAAKANFSGRKLKTAGWWQVMFSSSQLQIYLRISPWSLTGFEFIWAVIPPCAHKQHTLTVYTSRRNNFHGQKWAKPMEFESQPPEWKLIWKNLCYNVSPPLFSLLSPSFGRVYYIYSYTLPQWKGQGVDALISPLRRSTFRVAWENPCEENIAVLPSVSQKRRQKWIDIDSRIVSSKSWFLEKRPHSIYL